MTKADRLIEATAREINRLPVLKAKLQSLKSSHCSDCYSITIKHLGLQVDEIEKRHARLGSRVMRIATKHARNLLTKATDPS